MTHQQDVRPSPAGQHIRDATPGRILKFGNDTAFQLELRRRVDEHFRTTGRRQRDCWQMYVKTAILLAAFTGSYGLLVFGTRTWWRALPLAILLGLSAAGIGFNVQHDGGHQASGSCGAVDLGPWAGARRRAYSHAWMLTSGASSREP